MTGPKPRKKKADEDMSEDELATEAYGKKGRAVRKGLATLASTLPDSSVSSKLKSRVKSFLKRTTGG